MVLNISATLKDRVRRMVYAKARAEGLGIALMERIKADPTLGPLYGEHSQAHRESMMLEAKTLGMVGGDVDLLERLIRDTYQDDAPPFRTH